MAIFNLEYIREMQSKLNKLTILKKYFVKSDDGVDNCCIMVEGYKHPMRGRSAMIILRNVDGKPHVLCKDNVDGQDDYSMPGGGWNKGESPKDAAIREGHEETQCKIKDVVPKGLLIEYRDAKDKVKDWVKEHVPEDQWWYGYYSAIFVGQYDGKFTGHVDERDKEGGYKWLKTDEILKSLPKEYQNAITEYIKEKM